MAEDAAHLPPGFVIAGRYCVEGTIGQGGMAVVYRARHLGTEKPCALKLLLPELADDPKLRELFLQEARVSGRIGACPYIVDVFDTGVAGQFNTPFLAMELLHGATLGKLLRHRAVPRDHVEPILLQLGKGLEAAHKAGVVHRDLKPGNIFVSEGEGGEPQVKILDFGIAKVLEGPQGRTATQAGSPWYSAPEQLGGSMRKLAAKHGITISMGVSPATDVWAFGLCACELVLGLRASRYWGAETSADLMLRVSLEARRPPSDRVGVGTRVVPGFDEWFLRCTAHDAAARFQSALVAAETLVALLRSADRKSEQDVTLRLPPMALSDAVSAALQAEGAVAQGTGAASREQGAHAPTARSDASGQPSPSSPVAGAAGPPWPPSAAGAPASSQQVSSPMAPQGAPHALAGPGPLAGDARQPGVAATPVPTPSGSGSDARLLGSPSDSGGGAFTPSSLGFSDAGALPRMSLPGAETSSSWQSSAVAPPGRRRVALLAAAGAMVGLVLLAIVVVTMGLGSRGAATVPSTSAPSDGPSAASDPSGSSDGPPSAERSDAAADSAGPGPAATGASSSDTAPEESASSEPASTSTVDAGAEPPPAGPFGRPRPKGQEKLFEDF